MVKHVLTENFGIGKDYRKIYHIDEIDYNVAISEIRNWSKKHSLPMIDDEDCNPVQDRIERIVKSSDGYDIIVYCPCKD